MKYRSLLAAFIASCLAPQPAVAADEVFDSNGVKIAYVIEGQGEPIVLLHGWMSDSSMWGPLDTNPAAKEYQLIAVDLRGHGKSDKPHEPEKYGAEMAEDVVRLLDHLKLRKAHLVGYSMGAIVAGKVAATHPDRVLSIVYGGQAPILTEKVKADAREIEVFAKAVEEGKGLGSYLLEVMPADKPKLTAEQADELAKFLYGDKDVKAFAAAGRGIKDLDVTGDQLMKCKAPFLFVHGSKEAAATKERAAVIVKLLGRGEIKVIEGADHMTTLTDPEFGDTIDEFLRAVKVSSVRVPIGPGTVAHVRLADREREADLNDRLHFCVFENGANDLIYVGTKHGMWSSGAFDLSINGAVVFTGQVEHLVYGGTMINMDDVMAEQPRSNIGIEITRVTGAFK